MGTQGTGRKRSTKKERSTAEDDALNLIAREVSSPSLGNRRMWTHQDRYKPPVLTQLRPYCPPFATLIIGPPDGKRYLNAFKVIAYLKRQASLY